jgi:hypothetical protein
VSLAHAWSLDGAKLVRTAPNVLIPVGFFSKKALAVS